MFETASQIIQTLHHYYISIKHHKLSCGNNQWLSIKHHKLSLFIDTTSIIINHPRTNWWILSCESRRPKVHLGPLVSEQLAGNRQPVEPMPGSSGAGKNPQVDDAMADYISIPI